MNQKVIIGVLVAVVVVIGAFVIRDILNNTSQPQLTTETPSDATPVPVTDAKVQIEDIQVGTGEEVKSGDTIVMHYRGTLEDGTQFDSSYDRGEPFVTQIGTGAVIQGWDQGVPGMKVGGKRKLTIPPELGYGSADMGEIPPNSTLIFEVELLEIR